MSIESYSRLFEILEFQQLKFPQEVCLADKEGGTWNTYSTSEIITSSKQLAKGLIGLGLQPDQKVAIISNNQVAWNITDQAILRSGAVNVPIYPTISESEYEFIFNDAEIQYAFVSDADLFKKISSVKEKVPHLKGIFSFSEVEGCSNYKSLFDSSDQYDDELVNRSEAIKTEDVATIIYTSGTTGTPKGVMLSHKNVISNVIDTGQCIPMYEYMEMLSFLPLCHIFERMVTYVYMSKGASIYYAENMDTIADNLKEIRPHYFTTVPRLLEKVYDKIIAKGHELSGIKKSLFFWAVNLGLNFANDGKNSAWYNFKLGIARKLIFSKWKEALGGRIEGICVGAAALQPRLARVFNAGGIQVREGYGQTETSPVINFNRFDDPDGMLIGTVGPTIPGVQVKISEDRGEILVKGDNVMLGYYKRPDLTANVIDEQGWLHTGDVGEIVNGKFLKITGRVKEIFKTSGGKYVAPEPIENKMKESAFIEQIMVVGENEKFTAALVVPSFEFVHAWLEKNGITEKNPNSIIQLTQLQEKIWSEIESRNPEFSHIEQIKKIKLIPEEWTLESGELTPTMKLKRRNVMKRHADLLEEIYRG